MKNIAYSLGILLLLVSVNALAQAPKTLNYQGSLSNGGGPLNGSFNLTFAIYDAASGGTNLWTETSNNVTISNGNVTLILGKITPINIQIDKPLWMGITVDANPEISPRLELTASLYSLGIALPFSGNSDSPSNSFEITNTGVGGSAVHFENNNAFNTNPTIVISHAGTGNAITADAPVEATKFIGDGSLLTNLPSSGWGLSGNAGTVAGTHFIGTTDGTPLYFRVSNVHAGMIHPSTVSTFFGISAGSTTSTGWSNTAMGYYSLSSNTSGQNNTSVGQNGLSVNTTGSYNSAFGTNALNNNISGSNNTAIGKSALTFNNAGSSATAVGYGAMQFANNTSTPFINFNVAVGYESLRGSFDPPANTGNYNTAVGYQSLLNNEAGGSNSTLGVAALSNNTTGNNNSAVGYNALQSNITGSGNTALGYNSNVGSGGLNNTTAIGNGALVNTSNAIQLGNSAVTQLFAGTGTNATIIAGGLQITGGSPATGKVLTSNSAGVATWQDAAPSGWGLTGASGTIDGTNFIGNTDNVPLTFRVNNLLAGRIESTVGPNTFFGYLAGQANTTGIYNTASGGGALQTNTTGVNNTASGTSAMQWNTTGSANTAVGVRALWNSVASGANTAIGVAAMQNATNSVTEFSSNNVAVGYSALRGSVSVSANTGNLNTVVGNQAMLNNSSGSVNTASGANALQENTTGEGNTAIGGSTLVTNTTGSFNTALGLGADVASDALNNATALGYGAVVAASNTMQLGNLAVTHVFAGNINTTLIAGGLKITGGSLAAGKVLTSDASGVATWQAPAPGGWGLTGTGGTVDGTNFIGSTDDVPLTFKVNNQRAGRIEGPTTSNTFLGYRAGTSNTGFANTGSGVSALSNNTTGSFNTAVGRDAMFFNTTGGSNTAFGKGVLVLNVAGTGATAFGYEAMANTNNTNTPFVNTNVAVGYQALLGSNTAANNTGLGNTVVGFSGMINNANGNENTAIGRIALFNNASGNDNTAIGRAALTTNTTGSNNTALGNGADVSSAALNNASAIGNGAIVAASNTMQLGNSALTQVIAGTGTNATLVAGGLKITGGSLAAGKVLTSDATGVATWQTGGGWGLTGTSGTVDGTNFIGTTDFAPLNFKVNNIKAGKIDLLNNTFMGLASGNSNTTGSENTAIGTLSLNVNTAGSDNAAFGYNALVSNTGANNTAIGRSALSANTTGQFNTALGRSADVSTGSLTNATAIGANAVVSASNTIQLGNSTVTQIIAGTGNTATLVAGGLKITGGSPAAGKLLTSDAAGVATWQAAAASGWGLTGTTGTADGTNFIGTTDNVAVSFRANNQKAGRIDPAGPVFLGYQAGNINTSVDNTGIGYRALATNSTGDLNTASGYEALYLNTNGAGNTASGYRSARANTSGTFNTANGGFALSNNATGGQNTAVGYQALFEAVAGSGGTAIGTYALRNYTNTSSPFTNSNVAVGFASMLGSVTVSANTGNSNTAIGYNTLLENTSGSNNVADGYQALVANTTGNDNTAIGRGTLTTNATGSNNTALGNGADVGSSTLNNATALGNGAIVAASNTIQLGNSAVTQILAGTGTNATIIAGGLKITGGSPSAGKVLTSDAAGVATWQAAGSSGWGLAGNTSTVDGTDFIGTTDNVPLSLRVNNQKAGRIDQNGPTFIGYQAGNSNTSSNQNTGIGYRALFSNTAGFANTAVGLNAMLNNSGGTNNAATGLQALSNNTSGSGNAGFGYQALLGNINGSGNTALGYNANVGSGSLTNAAAIGNEAIVNVSNTMQFGNASVSEATLGNGNTSIFKVGEVRVGSGDYIYTSAKTRNLTLGNAAFVAAGPDGMTASRNVTTVAGIPTSVYTVNGPASPGISSFTAQVSLPHGAIVTDLTAYVFDTNATYDLSVKLTRQRVGFLTIDNMASVTSTGAPSAATYTTSSVSNATIDNGEFSYQVVFQSLANGAHAVYNVKLTYTVSRAD